MRSLFCVALSCALIACVFATDQFTIAVVEGKPIQAQTGKSVIQTNFEQYLLSKTLTDGKPDILVLPEFGLTGRTTKSKFAINIVTENVSASHEDLVYLNEKAKTYKFILVANLLENDDDDIYSTTVVLDGGDKLLAKYRTMNINSTSEDNLKSDDEFISFEHKTFGTIGLLSGMDIMFEQPFLKLKNETTTIIYTSSMHSVGPFRTAVSLQAGFAKANGVNLVVASLNDVDNQVSGSGIYTPCTTMATIGTDGTTPLIAKIDIKPKTNCTSSVEQILHKTLAGVDKPMKLTYDYEGLQTDIVSKNINGDEKCDGNFCCNFTISANDWKNENYRTVVVGGDQKICALMMCTDTDDKKIDTCGLVTNSPKTQFSEITIKTSEGDNLFMPYILHTDITPQSDMAKVAFAESTDDGTSFTIKDVKEAVAVGIVSLKSGASSLQTVATSFILMSVLLKYLF